MSWQHCATWLWTWQPSCNRYPSAAGTRHRTEGSAATGDASSHGSQASSAARHGVCSSLQGRAVHTCCTVSPFAAKRVNTRAQRWRRWSLASAEAKKNPRSVLCFPAGWCPFLYPRDCLLYYIDWFCLLYYIPFLLHPFFLVRSSEIILCASLAFKLYMLIHVLTGTQARSKLNRLQWGITTNLLVYLAAS